ncbi:MAG: alpha/beta fold hydrolase, partial [Vicinamibacterales bacterium]
MLESKLEAVAIQGQQLRIAYYKRPGPGPALVYLHGLGCSKKDVSGVACSRLLAGCRLIALDFPGCGDSEYPTTGQLTIADLIVLLHRFLRQIACETPALIGHSMGGLVALLFAQAHPDSVSALINVEGNLAPEDCTFSRAASEAPPETFRDGRYFANFTARLRASGKRGFAQYADELSSLVRPQVFRDYSVSILKVSCEAPLLETFERLSVPTLFLYGSENATLPYLPRLRAAGIDVVGVPNSDHFPARSAPDA